MNLTVFELFDEGITCRLAEGFEVLDRTGVGGEYFQRFTGLKALHALFRLQNRQRTIQPLGIECMIGHQNSRKDYVFFQGRAA